tara:strand:- start:1549 stop:2292 length:744 start_codon:yes stop_codon:yes gene_type:complete
MLLKNHTSVITGCNKGIGRSILENFSANGSDIFACVRKIDDEFKNIINSIEKNNKNNIYPVEIDLSDEESVKLGCKKILSKAKQIDNLVNNAGTISTSIFQMTSQKKYKELFEINFHSQILMTQYLIKEMIKRKKGSIIFISSSAAQDGNEGRSAYVSTKAAINAQSKVLAKEMGKLNIRVNNIAPGLTNTDMMKKNTPKNVIDDVLKNIPMGRVAEPSEIANAALFLASDLSSYITGQTIRVSGGM